MQYARSTVFGSPASRLTAIVDVDVAAGLHWAPEDVARAYLDGGARLLQLRAKRVVSGRFLELAQVLVDVAAGYSAHVVVNDRVDIARLSGAAGVHVGQDDIPAEAARAQLGDAAIVGVSTHTPEQVSRAADAPVTYVAIGPVFGTPTKDTGYDPIGLEMVSRARGQLDAAIPLVAIGGITLERARSVIDAGAQCVAVISDLLAGDDPAERVKQFLRVLA